MDGGVFRGFLVQGRLLADESTPVGVFSVIDSSLKLSVCSPRNVSENCECGWVRANGVRIIDIPRFH